MSMCFTRFDYLTLIYYIILIYTNSRKREQTADLKGCVAVVTGGRVRIGYATVLKLLRAGATVVATSRFPADAAMRYAREADFDAWCAKRLLRGVALSMHPSHSSLSST